MTPTLARIAALAALCAACGTMSAQTTGFPQGSLIRLADTGATFVVDGGGAKRWITNPQVFAACGLDWNQVRNLPRATIDAVPNGPQVGTPLECRAAMGRLPAGSLVRIAETGAVFLVDTNGGRRWVTNPQVFTECGLEWSRVQDLFRPDLDRVRDGAPLTTAAECRAVTSGQLPAVAPPPPAPPPPPPAAAAARNTPESVNRAAFLLTWEEFRDGVVRTDATMRRYWDENSTLHPLVETHFRERSANLLSLLLRDRSQARLDEITTLIAAALEPRLNRALMAMTWDQLGRVAAEDAGSIGAWYRPNPQAMGLQQFLQRPDWLRGELRKYSSPQLATLHGLVVPLRAP